MAGNLVKWWKHKILGGYKQFSVQECTTDSEELMYHQVRASSSCSAPPDLLLVSDRENNIPLRSPVVNIIGATTAPATTTTSPSSSALNGCHLTTSATNNNQRHNQKLQHHHVTATQQQQHQLSLAYNGTKDIANTKQYHQKQSAAIANSLSHNNKHGQQQQQLPQQQQDCQQQQSFQDIEGQLEATGNNHSSTRHAHHTQQQSHNNHHQSHQQQRSEEHIRLEEFTCDVSVEGGKSSQPLQFSFTFYDLDGHHGKITKDDIVGIVYTIYESIGKSVVVPHSGSKTINVRLTVSPEGKTKSSKTKKTQNSSSTALVLDSAQKSAPLSTAAAQAARRLHRYRPRKLIKSDEEDDDSNSDKERDITNATNHTNLSHVLSHHKPSAKNHKLHHKLKSEHHCCTTTTTPAAQNHNNTDLVNSPLDNIYDNLKANTTATSPETCRECLQAVEENRSNAISPIGHQPQQYPANNKISVTTTSAATTNEAYMKHVASTRIKMLRKSRKQKHQDCLETRKRSLSVGNETCWKNRHLQKQQNAQQQLLWHAEQQLNQSANGGTSVLMDGVQLRNPLKAVAGSGVKSSSSSSAQKRNSAECWKSALNRNDLISIIRESMEKNRLCFQLNGKPQANVSPIRHSQPPLPPTTQQQQHQQHLHHSQQNNSKQSQHHHQQQQQHQTSTTNSHQHHQRQRSNTVSKIPTLIAHHNNSNSAQQSSHYHRSSSCANTISSSNNNNNNHPQHDTSLHDTTHNNTNSSNSNNIYQPHIPIYHQQLPINPAVIAAHNALLNGGSGSGSGGGGGSNTTSAGGHHGKMNLCGYDSFLHATICGGGGLSHSPPAHSSLAGVNVTSPTTLAATAAGYIGQQQIATVQPIMSSSNTHNANNKHLSLAAVTPNQIKTSKILRSGSYNQTHAHTTQNSPQYHGYQRLPSSSKHNLAALHLVSPTTERPPLDQLDKWRREQVKNYDQLLYAKLSEKLQQTNLVSSSPVSSNLRESQQRRKHRIMKQRRAQHLNFVQENQNVSSIITNKLCVREDSDYACMLPIEGDAVECENLLAQSSDEENQSQGESPLQTEQEKITEQNLKANNHHVAEGTLVDLDDVVDDEEEEEHELGLQKSHKLTKLPLNADTLLRVQEDEVHDLHLDDPLDIEEDLEEDLDDDLDEDVVADLTPESGRNSAASNVSSNGGGASLANANSAANTSTTSSSLIHRYVHEHIHHHYHHFEEKEE